MLRQAGEAGSFFNSAAMTEGTGSIEYESSGPVTLNLAAAGTDTPPFQIRQSVGLQWGDSFQTG